MTSISETADADHCRFCGTADAQFFGEAYTYVRWPADIDREDGVFHFRICSTCALSEREHTDRAAGQFRPGDRDYLQTCDVCGAVGCRSASIRAWGSGAPAGATADGTFRIRSVLSWSVEIQGFDGSATACVECGPIETIECVRRPDRTHDEEATVLVMPPFNGGHSLGTMDVNAETKQAAIDEWSR